MTANTLRQKFIEYYRQKNHANIPSAAIVPENDPTTLFTGSGMQPLIPYLLGQKHPLGTRLVNSQIAFRSEDIEEVGDNRHTTIFEMLGNWSLGDYFKKEQLRWLFTFLTDEIGLNPQKIYITAYEGDPKNNISKDSESVALWKKLFKEKGIDAQEAQLGSLENAAKLGMGQARIFYYRDKNWWSRSGVPQNMPPGEPGGPDSEVFYLFDKVSHNPKYGENCHPNCDCGRFIEIGNSVFMEYQKTKIGFQSLPKKNVDFGGGLERMLACVNDSDDIFQTDLFLPVIKILEKTTKHSYDQHRVEMQIIADHFKAAVIMISQGLEPSNKAHGYILRRLIRRAVVKLHSLVNQNSVQDIINQITNEVGQIYQDVYIKQDSIDQISKTIIKEALKFEKTLKRGVVELKKLNHINGESAFNLFQSFGFPLEMIREEAKNFGLEIKDNLDAEFEAQKSKHSQISRTASKGMFKGGLADQSQTTIKYHTVTHLLHQALRNHLGKSVYQLGSNITSERLRFDFNCKEDISETQLAAVEAEINKKIIEKIPVYKNILKKDQALSSGALALFKETYPDLVSVYTIGKDTKNDWYSKEICGGPHVESTSELSEVKITKLKSIGSSAKRIYLQFK